MEIIIPRRVIFLDKGAAQEQDHPHIPKEYAMKRICLFLLVAFSLAFVSCGKIRGKYRCVFNCACKDRNIVHELEFVGSRSVVISDSLEKRTVPYSVDGKRVILEEKGSPGTITILDNRTLIIQGAECLSGTYRRIE